MKNRDLNNQTDRAAAVSLQELAAGGSTYWQEDFSDQQRRQDDVNLTESWNQGGMFWGDEHIMPFAVGGLPFDFDMDFPI